MAYYYVKSGGTAAAATDNGRYASQQTGSFATIGASGYYDNVTDACAASTAPDHGDYICVSDASSYTVAANKTWFNTGLSAVAADVPLTFMTVSDTNCDQYAVASSVQEESTTGDILMLGGSADSSKFTFLGLSLKSADDLGFGAAASQAYLQDCTFESNGVNDLAFNSIDAGDYHLVNCTFKANTTVNSDFLGMQSPICIDCTWSTDSVSNKTKPAWVSATKGTFINCDFSASKVTSLYTQDTATRGGYGRFFNCAMPTSLTSYNSNVGSMIYHTHETLVTGCASSADPSDYHEYQYYFARGNNVIEEETSIYRDGSTAFPSGQKISLKCVTTASNTAEAPFEFEFPTRYSQLSDTTSDTLTLYILSSAALTDADVWATVSYSDGTNTHIPNRVVSASYDPFRTGTTLTTNTEAWTGRTSENRYEISLDTSTDAGADCVPIIRVYVAKASWTGYLCPTLGVS